MHKMKNHRYTMDELIKLVSSDGVPFSVSTELARHSKTLSTFIDTNRHFVQAKTKEIHLPIKSKYLKRILDFMVYTHNKKNLADTEEFKIADEETMDLLEIASYLRI